MTPFTGLIATGSFVLGLVLGIGLCRALLWQANNILRKAENQAGQARRMQENAVALYTSAAKDLEKASNRRQT